MGANYCPRPPRTGCFVEIPNGVSGGVFHVSPARWIIPADHQVTPLCRQVDRSCHPQSSWLTITGFASSGLWPQEDGGHPVSAGEELPIPSLQGGNFRPQHTAQNHVITAVPEAVVRKRVHVLAGIVRINAASAIFNKVRGREAPSREHGTLIVLAHRTAPGTPEIGALMMLAFWAVCRR